VYAQDPVSVGLPAMLAAKILHKKFYLKIVGDYAWEQGVQRFGVADDLDKFSAGYLQYSFPVRALKQVERYVALCADQIITPSEYLKKIITHWHVSPGKITVIHNGVKVPVIHGDKVMLREKLCIKGYTLLSAGRLVPWKGFAMLIEMMPDLIKKIPDAHLYVVGSGPFEARLRSIVKNRNLKRCVTLLGGLPQGELFEYIKASDVFVLNTSYEGFSHQLIEVMALGTPVVTTSAGGNAEIIRSGVSGFLVDYNNQTGFMGAIEALCSDTFAAEQIVVNAKEKVLEFTDERMLDATTALFAQAQ
jgi:glycosyltransferase involved in cell wall biosynthesis